jgi:hypothetical protein
MDKIIGSKKFKIAAVVLAVFIWSGLLFAGGVAVGLMKARFSYSWGRNYERNFIGPRHGMIPGELGGHGFHNPHGLSGAIISINGNIIVIKDNDNQENTVTANDKTLIKHNGDDIKVGDLKPNERIVVLGKPDGSGNVSADLIRVFDNGDNMDENGNINDNNNQTTNQ